MCYRVRPLLALCLSLATSLLVFAQSGSSFAAPATLSAASLKATAFTLKWTAATGANGGIAGYDVYRDGSLIGSVPASPRTLAVTGLAPLTAYSMTVVARDNSGAFSASSAPLVVTTPADTTPPSRPTGVSSTPPTTTSLTLSWSASTDNVGVTGYNVYRANVLLGSATTTSFAVSGLEPDTNYRLTVRALDAAGNRSPASAAVTVRTLAEPPSTPTALAIANLKAASFTLKWAASAGGTGGIAAYDVYRDGVLFGTTTKKSFAFTGQVPLTTYAVTVAARDHEGRVSASATPVSATTLADTTKPSVPNDVAAAAVTHQSFTLQWTPSTDNVGVVGYEVLKNGAVIGSPAVPAFAVSGLSALTTYQMRVRARDAAGNLSGLSPTLAVATEAPPNVDPVVTLAQPAAGSNYTAPATLTLLANATDADGTVAKVEFFDGTVKLGESTTASTPPASYSLAATFTRPGPHELRARATDNRNATVDSAAVSIRVLAGLPYLANFEEGEGYALGSVHDQLGWSVAAGSANVTVSDYSHGEQSLQLAAGATVTVADQEIGRGVVDLSPVFVDIFAKPAAGGTAASGSQFDLDNARVALVLNGTSARLAAYDGDGQGGGAWRVLEGDVTIDNERAAGWLRITARLDYGSKIWDLYLDSRLLAHGLGFRGNAATYLSGLSFRGHPTVGTLVDDIYAGGENPLFADVDRDGMEDAWENAHGLNSAVNDRAGDVDGDGLTNIEEYRLGTNPQKADTDDDGLNDAQEKSAGTDPLLADTDGDGLSDGWEQSHGLDPKTDDAALDADGDGQSNSQEFVAGTDPQDFFNGQTPILTVLTGGEGGQPGPDGLVRVQVTNSAGDPLANAPVNFLIASGSGRLSASIGGSPAAAYATRTGGDGTAFAYYLAVSGIYPAGTVTVQTGVASVSIAIQDRVGGVNQPPVAIVVAPSAGMNIGSAHGIVLLADAYDPDGVVAKVEFLVDGAKIGEAAGEPFYLVWSVAPPGAHEVTVRAVDNVGAKSTSAAVAFNVTAASGPLASHDFETAEGYSAGPLVPHPGWTVSDPSLIRVVSAAAQSGQQSLSIGPPSSAHTVYAQCSLPASGPDEIERFIDFWWKPVADLTVPESSHISVVDGPSIGFVQDGATAELWAYINNEGSEETWRSGINVPIAADGSVRDWQHVVIRLKRGSNRLDVYLNGRLAVANVWFFAGSEPVLTVYGHSQTATYIDNIKIWTDNPVFADADHDGLDDVWEATHGLNPGFDDRLLDGDQDGIKNIEEFRLDTSPSAPAETRDRDNNGFPDSWERDNFGQIGIDPSADPDDDGLDNRQEYLRDTKPRLSDTDGDGVNDGEEIALGTNPKDATSHGTPQLAWLVRRTTVTDGSSYISYWPGVSAFQGDLMYGRFDWKATLSGNLPPSVTKAEINFSMTYQEDGTWVVENEGFGYGGVYGTFPIGRTVYPGVPLFWWDVSIISGFSTFLKNEAAANGGSVNPTNLSYAKPETYFSGNDVWHYTTTIQASLSAPTAPVYESTPGSTVVESWSVETPTIYRGNGVTPTEVYKVVVPEGTTEKVRWFEVFTPDDGSPKEYHLMEWAPNGRTTSNAYTLAAPRNGAMTVLLLDAQLLMAVDANRDGEITFGGPDSTDATTRLQPYRFWTNDDIDRWHLTNNDLFQLAYEQDDLETSPDGRLDWQENTFQSPRDLEDFSRIWISMEGLTDLLRAQNGEFYLGLKWTGVPEGASKPAIKLFKSVEADGATRYLTDPDVSSQQISRLPATGFAILDARYAYGSDPDISSLGNLVEESDFFVLPKSLFADISEAHPRLHLLFEGCKPGVGQLKPVLLKRTGNTYAETGDTPGVWMNLQPVQELYQTWTVGDRVASGVGDPHSDPVVPNTSYSPVPGSPSLAPPVEDAEHDFILLVHGWNMTIQEKNHFAETAFKRLWWQGYRGRFGLFRWPTFYTNPEDPNGIGPILDPTNFDASEWNSWRSAAGLAQLLTDLKGVYQDASGNSRVRVIAHSHGNLATGEALRSVATPVVHTYVATQAAIATHCYDDDPTRVPDISAAWASLHWYLELLDHPELMNPMLAAFSGEALAIKTPNVYAYYPGNAGMDVATQFPQQGAPYMTGAKGARKWVNYYNTSDWALDGWITNQAFKPDLGYNYRHLSGSFADYGVTGWWFTGPSGLLSIPEDRHQIFSFAAQARSQPLGRQGGVMGLFAGQDHSWNEFGDKHPGHSAQFRSSVAERWNYWERLMISFELKQVE